MKNRQETQHIVETLAAHPEERFALATVLQIEGSSYRRPGAKLLIAENGTLSGQLSGGCLEETVRVEALSSIETGIPLLLRLDTTDQEGTLWGFGMGCQGVLHILVEPIGWQRGWCDRLHDAFSAGDEFTWTREVNMLTGDISHRVEPGVSTQPALQWESQEITHGITESFKKPTRLVIFGAGDDAMPLVQTATSCGFQVVVVDHRPAYCTPDRFPSAHRCVVALSPQELDFTVDDMCVVIQTHRFDKDEEWLLAAATSSPNYIGLLGPVHRCKQLREIMGMTPKMPIYGPIGLDVGAQGSEQIAVSILAEILAILHQREPRHMKDTAGKIHT